MSTPQISPFDLKPNTPEYKPIQIKEIRPSSEDEEFKKEIDTMKGNGYSTQYMQKIHQTNLEYEKKKILQQIEENKKKQPPKKEPEKKPEQKKNCDII